MLHTLVPSFLADLVWPEHRSSWKLHRTSYLDGLRGLASFVVFICHYTEENHRYMVPTYGLNKDGDSSFVQLPFLRIIFSGRPMVHIFFVISGFVLSYKPLKSIHSYDIDKCYAVLSSSAFRRPIRLFAPCVVSTFIILVLIQAGWLYKPLPSVSEQMNDWLKTIFHNITWPWGWDALLNPRYDIHLWTIPIEFAHSMLLFLVVLMLARAKAIVRQSMVFMLMVYCLACGKWAAFEFFAGMFLAEIQIRQSTIPKYHELSAESTAPMPRSIRSPILHYGVHACIVLTWAFIGGWPNHDHKETPGIRYLFEQTPSAFVTNEHDMPQRFWFAVSAAFMVWSCGEVDFVRKFLEGGLAQYCGRISYAIYIVHGPVLGLFQRWVVGHAHIPVRGVEGTPDFAPEVLGAGVKGFFGDANPAQRTLSWFVGLLILGPIVTWASDLFWRLVDLPVISLGRRLENACLDHSDSR
ncbi:Hard surface induced protein [Pleurostoma richardsiae]|uniref:Hard surface induced protein n=1 Tax=Pleurostoma richardsiae TaxID=41990 RepID=A0AA38S134_9PEZI|nr:Hard surface induced protein [Pleurostoma richardsiae]